MTVAQLDVALDRPMPQSPDAERAVLGSILTNANAFYRVIATIGTEDFFKDAHRTIFTAMRRLAEESREIDLLTVKEELTKRGALEQAGGSAYVSSLTDAPPDVANVERYAHIVKEKSTLRRLIVMGNSVMRAALDAPSEPADVLNIAEKSIYEIAEGSIEKGFVALDRITRSNMTAIEQLQHAGKLITGIPTGYDRFNEFTSGFQPQDLIIIAARPSMGKTSFMINIDDTPGIDIMEMRAKARRLKMEAGLDMIMVDYLQLMAVKGKTESRNQEVSQISRGLKAIAKELNVPLVALSQLSRRPEQRTGDHRPQLSDLRESGSIEQDADVVCFIYRDEVYNKDTEEKGIAEIIIGKQRNGPIGDFKLVFRNDITKFFNYEPTPDYAPQ